MLTFFDHIDVTPVATGEWVDTDLSAYLPSGATGAALAVVSSSENARLVGSRPHGSSANFYKYLCSGSRVMHIVACDASRHVDLYRQDGDEAFYLLAALDSDFVLFSPASYVDVSTATTGSYQDVDITAHVTGGDTAIAAIVFVEDGGSDPVIGLRANGSSFDDPKEHYFGGHSIIVPVDAGEVFEQKTSNAGETVYLQGYIKGDAWTFLDPPTEIGPAGAGSYADLAALPAGATAGYYFAASGYEQAWHVRKNGTSTDHYKLSWGWGASIVELDANRVAEAKVESTGMNLYVWGYYAPAPDIPEALTINAYQSGSNIIVAWS
jgi:hypothetical protein